MKHVSSWLTEMKHVPSWLTEMKHVPSWLTEMKHVSSWLTEVKHASSWFLTGFNVIQRKIFCHMIMVGYEVVHLVFGNLILSHVLFEYEI